MKDLSLLWFVFSQNLMMYNKVDNTFYQKNTSMLIEKKNWRQQNQLSERTTTTTRKKPLYSDCNGNWYRRTYLADLYTKKIKIISAFWESEDSIKSWCFLCEKLIKFSLWHYT